MGPLKGNIDTGVVIFGLLFFGVGMILLFRAREPVFYTGPAVTVYPSTSADVSTVRNQVNAIKALSHLIDTMNQPPASANDAEVT